MYSENNPVLKNNGDSSKIDVLFKSKLRRRDWSGAAEIIREVSRSRFNSSRVGYDILYK